MSIPQAVRDFLFAPVNGKWLRWFSAGAVILTLINFRVWDPYTGRLFFPALTPWHDVAEAYQYRILLCVAAWFFAWGVKPRLSGGCFLFLAIPFLAEATRMQSRLVMMITLLCLLLLHGGHARRALPAWPLRLIQLQLSLIYGINALAKMSPAYLSGDVLVAMAMTLPNFLIDMSDGFYHLGPLKISAAAAAWGTVLIEGFLAVGFWIRPLRWATAVLGVLFHIVLMGIVSIGMLDWTSMFLYLAFVMPLIQKTKPSQRPANP